MIEMTEKPNVIEQKAAAPCFQVQRLVSALAENDVLACDPFEGDFGERATVP